MSGRRGISVACIRAAALAVLPDLLRHWLPGGEYRRHLYVALNPLRIDRKLGSFQIDTQTGRWADHAIGHAGRDPVSLYAYLFHHDDYRAALKRLADDPFVQAAITTSATAPAAKAANPAKASADKTEVARRIYRTASDISARPAETYLLSRGLLPTDAWEPLRASTLRHPSGGRHPVLIAPVTSPEGVLVGIHRTYLAPPGHKLDVPAAKLTLGRVRGCAIRFGQPGRDLIICEGIEDALSLYQQLDGLAVWAACGAAFLPLMQIPEAVLNLTVAADNDHAGELATHRAAEALQAPGRAVRIMRPEAGFKDFNDELRGVRDAQ